MALRVLNIDLNYFHGDLATLKARFKLDGTTPGGGGTSNTWYKVTAAALYVREGPSTKEKTVGTLYRNDVVEGIEVSTDGAWIKIKRPSDGLTGWSSRSYLIITIPPSTPPTEPPTEPPSTTKWYKVNASALNVREGPGTSYKSLGTLKRYEVVEELDVSSDGAWIKIKRYSDGLIGWSSKTYLVLTTAPSPLPTDPPPTEPPPTTTKWYKVNAFSLNVREGPSTSYKSLGTVKRDEVVEELDVSSDGDWVKIKRYSDGLIGWSSKSYLILTTAPSPLPTDPPPTEPPPTTTTWYVVNASALNVREGPSTSYKSLGTVKRNEVVEELDVSADGVWAQIKRYSDGLVGWSSKAYLVVTTAPSPLPTDPPSTDPPPTTGDPPPDGNGGSDPAETWYRVTATSLNVREQPSTSAQVTGSVKINQVVMALEVSTDGSWIRIKRPYDGLTGWSSKDYLVATSAPNPADDPVKNWYKVTATTMYVREGPSADDKSLGYVQKDDIVRLLDSSSDGSWAKILRLDGLEGWASSQYLLHLDEAPGEIRQNLFTGVTYTRKETSSPRKIVSHILAIDLNAPDVGFLVTPPLREKLPELCTQKTSQFLAKNNLQIAINGDGFYYLDAKDYPPQNYCSDGGDPVRLIGYAASRGKEYAEKAPGKPILFINRNNEITFDKPKGAVYNALTGDRMLVDKNEKITGLDTSTFDPRTAIGMNQNGRWVYIMVVDGREFSEGVNFDELADMMLSVGAYTAVALDGGGSSTLVIEGPNGQPHALSTLIDENVPGQERLVANHLGLFVKK